MSERKAEPKQSANVGARVKEATPNWEKILYTPERWAAFEKGEMNLRDYHAINGPEMLQMALIGFRLYEQGKYSEARTIFSGLISLEPLEAYYHTALGAVFLAEENLQMARAYFDSAIALNPREIAPYVNRGEVNLRDGKILEAATDFSKAIELDPKFADPLTQRARLLSVAVLEMVEGKSQKQAAEGKSEKPGISPPKESKKK